jgi:hypothetical protein
MMACSRRGDESRDDTRVSDSDPKDATTKQIDEWLNKTAACYRCERETREGTTELAERAMEAEHERDTALARYHIVQTRCLGNKDACDPVAAKANGRDWSNLFAK